MFDPPPISAIEALDRVRIFLLRGEAEDVHGIRRHAGDLIELPGARAAAFLMNGSGDPAATVEIVKDQVERQIGGGHYENRERVTMPFSSAQALIARGDAVFVGVLTGSPC
jgi:hypothetical protein